jgi:hypothetical protein
MKIRGKFTVHAGDDNSEFQNPGEPIPAPAHYQEHLQ